MSMKQVTVWSVVVVRCISRGVNYNKKGVFKIQFSSVSIKIFLGTFYMFFQMIFQSSKSYEWFSNYTTL